MKTRKHLLDRISIVILIASLLVTVLFMNGEALGMTKIVDEDAETYTGTDYFTANDLNGTWADEFLYASEDTSAAGLPAAAGAGSLTAVISLNGDSAEITGNGAYVRDGDVYITGGGYYLLSGTLTDGSIIVDAYNSSKVWLLLNGADITCADGPAIQVLQAEKVFLTLAADTVSTLTDGENYSEAVVEDGADGVIYSHDDLTINGSGSLVVNGTYRHGIEANDEFVITGGSITINSVSDGIHVNDSVRITGADITISAGDDAVHCDTEIIFADGSLLINDCYEGLEAPQILVLDGEITIYPEDDGFNANSGSSFGFGMMGGGGFARAGQSASETAEGILPDSSAASTASRGTSANSNTADDADEMPCIDIRGGTITIINENGRDADGLDSNGDILISGGTVYISLVNSGSNCAIDCGSESGGVMRITGGTVIACGSSSMAEGFDSSSTQCAVLYNTSDGAAAGTTFAVENADGNVLLSWDVPCSYSSVNVSFPELEVGETYLIVIGDNVEEITLSEISASYGDASSSMFGGAMNWGGMQKREGGQGRGMRHNTQQAAGATEDTESEEAAGESEMSEETEMPEGMEMPEGIEFPEGMEPPEGMEMSEGMEPPEGMEMSEGMEPPESSDSHLLAGRQEWSEEPADQGHGMRNGDQPMGGLNATSSELSGSEVSGSGVLLTDLGKETWISLGISAAALIMAILYARNSQLRKRF